MGTPLAQSRRPTSPRRTVAAASAIALVALLAAAQPALAGIGYTESLRVDAGGSRTARTSVDLLAGHTYRVDVSGLYRVDGLTADAECSMSQLDPIYKPDSANSAYELLVNRRDITWAPVQRDLMGCDSTAHQYSISVRPSADGPLELTLNIPAGADSADGVLDVQITGDAAAGGTPTTAPPAPPTSSVAPPTSAAQPTTTQAGAAPTTPTAKAPPASSRAKMTPEARAALEDLLGTYGVSKEDVMIVTQAAEAGGGLAPDYGKSAGSPMSAVLVLGIVAMATAAAAASPLRRRVLAAARGIDGFDIGLRQTAHRGAEATVASAATAAPPAKTARTPLRRRTNAALAHRSTAAGERVATLIVDELPGAGTSPTSACTCGYCK